MVEQERGFVDGGGVDSKGFSARRGRRHVPVEIAAAATSAVVGGVNTAMRLFFRPPVSPLSKICRRARARRRIAQ